MVDQSLINPLSGLEWSPTWFPISLSHRAPTLPASLTTMAMATVIKHPELVEEVCSFLPQSLREEMVAMALEEKMTNATIPLLYTWTKPVLSLKSIFPTINQCPELVGDMHNQVNATRIGCLSVTIVTQLVIKKVVSILVKNPRAVKCLDLSGFPVLRQTLEELLRENFNAREKLTIILDIWIPEHGTGDSNWINILNGSNNFTFTVQNIYICSLREPVRNQVIASALRTNKDVRGLKLSSLNFVDWPEVRRTLHIIETCPNLSMLDLSRNNMFDSSANDTVGRSWVNKSLRSLPYLSRLDLSYNLLTDRVEPVLKGLSLTYLNLTASHLSTDDLKFLVTISTLVHLDLSQNSIGELLHDIKPKSNFLMNIEILELEDCFISPHNFEHFFSFIKSCSALKILNLSYNTLKVSQIIQLIQRRVEVLLVFSKMACSCTITRCTCYQEAKVLLSQSLSSEGYQLRSFDKESASHAIDTSDFIVFKAFLSSKL